MIEGAENTLQLAVLILCVAVALYRAVELRSRRWTLLSFFYISWVLGDCYWLLCVIFYGDTPRISVVSDLSWYVSYVLLYLMLRQIAPPEECAGNRILPWLGPLFTGAMVPVFIRWGNIPGNLICAVLMGLLLFAAIWRQTSSTSLRCGSAFVVETTLLAASEHSPTPSNASRMLPSRSYLMMKSNFRS